LFALLDINARNIAYKPLAKLQLPLYTYSHLQRKQTNGGGSGWSIEGCEKYDELFMAVKVDRKQNAKQFNPQLCFFFKLVAVANNLQSTMQRMMRMMHAQKPKWRIIA
jgi:hypothetical protein